LKIGIICNHSFGLPSINYLLNNNLIAGFAVPNIENQVSRLIKQLSSTRNLPMATLNKQTLTKGLKNWLNKIEADVVFVFSFPYKIPEIVLNTPPFGFINFHPSLLPAYCGPDPIFWQIRDGQMTGGITSHKVDEKIDSGPIYSVEHENIYTSDTYGQLESRLSFTLLRCVTKLVNIMSDNGMPGLTGHNQDASARSYFKKPTESDLAINWKKQSSVEILNLVRACNPIYQGAIAFFRNFPLHILEVSIIEEEDLNEESGTIQSTVRGNGLTAVTVDKKLLSLDVIYIQEGCFSGTAFQKQFKVAHGEKLNSL